LLSEGNVAEGSERRDDGLKNERSKEREKERRE